MAGPRSPQLPPRPASDEQVQRVLEVLRPGEIDACWRVFGPYRLAQLVREFELTGWQIYRLAVAVRNVAFDLQHSAAPSDVRAALADVERHLLAARERIEQWERSGAKSPLGREALGHLNRAHAGLAPVPDDGTWPQFIVASEVIKLAALLAKRALDLAPPEDSRRPRKQQRAGEAASVPASWRAITWIVEALHEPKDDASRERAAALPVRRSSRAGGAFEHLAGLVFAAALGLDDDTKVSPRRSIDAYVKRQRGGGVDTQPTRAHEGG